MGEDSEQLDAFIKVIDDAPESVWKDSTKECYKHYIKQIFSFVTHDELLTDIGQQKIVDWLDTFNKLVLLSNELKMLMERKQVERTKKLDDASIAKSVIEDMSKIFPSWEIDSPLKLDIAFIKSTEQKLAVAIIFGLFQNHIMRMTDVTTLYLKGNGEGPSAIDAKTNYIDLYPVSTEPDKAVIYLKQYKTKSKFGSNTFSVDVQTTAWWRFWYKHHNRNKDGPFINADSDTGGRKVIQWLRDELARPDLTVSDIKKWCAQGS